VALECEGVPRIAPLRVDSYSLGPVPGVCAVQREPSLLRPPLLFPSSARARGRKNGGSAGKFDLFHSLCTSSIQFYSTDATPDQPGCTHGL